MLKIGQVIKFKTDHKIELESGGTALVKKGDSAQILKKIDNKTAQVLYLTGEAKGKYQNLAIEVDDSMDADEIAKRLLRELNSD
ncbi:MAG: hypothetical protein Q8936_12125 [Bacillota bacterium]|nr:hypothetical protein [Bacillota bacterium]